MYTGQPSVGQAQVVAPKTENGIRDRLTVLLDRAVGIHHHADNLQEHCFGAMPQEVPPPLGIKEARPTMVDLCDQLEFHLRKIDDALEFLTARL